MLARKRGCLLPLPLPHSWLLSVWRNLLSTIRGYFGDQDPITSLFLARRRALSAAARSSAGVVPRFGKAALKLLGNRSNSIGSLIASQDCDEELGPSTDPKPENETVLKLRRASWMWFSGRRRRDARETRQQRADRLYLASGRRGKRSAKFAGWGCRSKRFTPAGDDTLGWDCRSRQNTGWDEKCERISTSRSIDSRPV